MQFIPFAGSSFQLLRPGTITFAPLQSGILHYQCLPCPSLPKHDAGTRRCNATLERALMMQSLCTLFNRGEMGAICGRVASNTSTNPP